MRKHDRAYLGDYTLSPGTSDDWIYTGKKYVYSSQGAAKTAVTAMSVLSALSLLLFFAAGIADNRASFTPWVFLPYVVCFLPLAFLFGNSVSLFRIRGYLTRKQYEKNVLGEKRLSVLLTVPAAVSLAADAVMYFVSARDFRPWDIVFSLECVLLLATGIAGAALSKNLACCCDRDPAE